MGLQRVGHDWASELNCVTAVYCQWWISKRNSWSRSHNSKTLGSDTPLEIHLTSVFKRRNVCSTSISSQRCKQMWFKAIYFNMVDNFNHIIQNMTLFLLASISVWITQCAVSHSEVTSLTWVVKPESCPVMTSAPSMHIATQNDQFHFPYEWHIIHRVE